MTAGHKHRMLHIDHDFDWWPVRLLRKPLLHRSADTNQQWRKIEGSPYPYGACAKHSRGVTDVNARCWVLTPLGILHRWTGLTLCTWPRPCPVHDPICPDDNCEDCRGAGRD